MHIWRNRHVFLLVVFCSAIGSVATSTLVAWGLGLWAQPPSSWLIWNNHIGRLQGNLAPEATRQFVESDKNDVIINEARGLGYQSYDIIVDNDPAQRHFITLLGWPIPWLETTSQSVGFRFARPGTDMNVADTVTGRASAGMRMRWGALLFNSLLFCFPIAVIGLTFIRFHNAARLCLKLAICLGIGLWMSVFTGWCAALVPVEHRMNYRNAYEDTGLKLRTVSGAQWQLVGSEKVDGIGYSYRAFDYVKVGNPERRSRLDHFLKLGYPFHCLGTDRPLLRQQEGFVRSVLQMPPLWPGLIANWIVYSSLALLVITIPKQARRRFRRNRHRCEACGYPMGTSPRCSECGITIRPLAASTKE